MKSKEDLKKHQVHNTCVEIPVDASEDKEENVSVLDNEIDEEDLDNIDGAAFADTEFGRTSIAGVIGIGMGITTYTITHALQKNKIP